MSRPAKPPVAAKKPAPAPSLGETRIDEYAWLRDRKNAAVLAHLRAENAHTVHRMRRTRGLQRRLFAEMRGRIKETDVDVPVRMGAFFYYSRTRRGKQYEIYCRKKGGLEGPEKVLLDENQLAAGHKYFDVGLYRISPDHGLLAYSVDTKGDERYTLRIKNLQTGRHLRHRLANVSSASWANDSRTLFYVVMDAAHRPYKLYRHELGQPQSRDELIYHERDASFHASVSKSRSRDYLFLDLHAKTTSEVRFLSASRPAGRFRLVQRRRRGLEYGVEHHGDSFFILHNHRAENFKLARAPVRSPSMGHWRTVIAHRAEVMIESIDAFAEYLVISERERGLPQIRVRNLASGSAHRVAFREPAYSVWVDSNPEFESRTLRFAYTSLVTPESVFDYDMKTRRRTLMKQDEVPGGYDPKRYRTERIVARSAGGARVPVSLVFKNGLRRDGRNAALLNAYGAYGTSSDPEFSALRLSLLDRGLVYAIAHVRGGSELGRSWYEDGKFLRKKNTFFDVIAGAEALVRRGYTSPSRLALSGASAGGLLVGAVLNLRPDLFRVAVADVPFVDVLNTMLDASLPLTVFEYDEWGNPNDPRYYRYIQSYSPYENVRPRAYPTMLVTAGLNDPRVSYWEPAKWVSRLRALKTDDNELLLKTEMGSGHFGASGRYDHLKEIAFEYAFILTRLGVER